MARKRDVGGYSKLMDKAAKCLHRLFELAPTKKRNYILDQVKVTVYSSFISSLTYVYQLNNNSETHLAKNNATAVIKG